MAHLAGCQYSVIDVSQSLGVTTVARLQDDAQAVRRVDKIWCTSLVDSMVNIYLMAKMRCFRVSS